LFIKGPIIQEAMSDKQAIHEVSDATGVNAAILVAEMADTIDPCSPNRGNFAAGPAAQLDKYCTCGIVQATPNPSGAGR
jgi:hypothetical protein